jgi:hypothetical protein
LIIYINQDSKPREITELKEEDQSMLVSSRGCIMIPKPLAVTVTQGENTKDHNNRQRNQSWDCGDEANPTRMTRSPTETTARGRISV